MDDTNKRLYAYYAEIGEGVEAIGMLLDLMDKTDEKDITGIRAILRPLHKQMNRALTCVHELT